LILENLLLIADDVSFRHFRSQPPYFELDTTRAIRESAIPGVRIYMLSSVRASVNGSFVARI
jgi:hypothetical protein